MAQILKDNRSDNRGGKRENAGRKKKDTMPFQIRCKKENINFIRNWIKDNNF